MFFLLFLSKIQPNNNLWWVQHVNEVNCPVFVCCRAEIECQAYRKVAAQKGVSVDDTDEEWAERGKEHEDEAISKSNIQTQA